MDITKEKPLNESEAESSTNKIEYVPIDFLIAQEKAETRSYIQGVSLGVSVSALIVAAIALAMKLFT